MVSGTASTGGEPLTFEPGGELRGGTDESLAEYDSDLGGISKTPGNSPTEDDLGGTTEVNWDSAGTTDSTGGIDPSL